MAGNKMITFLAYIWRLIVIFTGFAAAAIAASLFFVIVGLLSLENGADSAAFDTVLDLAGTMLLFATAVATFSSMLLAIPVFVLAIFAEYFKWNGFLFHGAAGALLGASATGLWQMSRSAEGQSQLALVGAAAGIVGAGVYWLVAGRNAGKLFERIAADRHQ
jgi:uncharacterized protein YjeT (DUF2065 family)